MGPVWNPVALSIWVPYGYPYRSHIAVTAMRYGDAQVQELNERHSYALCFRQDFAMFHLLFNSCHPRSGGPL